MAMNLGVNHVTEGCKAPERWSPSMRLRIRSAPDGSFSAMRNAKKPSDCAYAQLEVVPPKELMAIVSGGR
jgi:hypothetical protein